MVKLERFVQNHTNGVLGLNNQYQLRACYDRAAGFYQKPKMTAKKDVHSNRDMGNQIRRWKGKKIWSR